MDFSGDFAERIDLGNGRRLHLACRGNGSPAVILESGYGHSGRVWETDVLPGSWEPPDVPRTTVFDGVAGFTRVCLTDRPGTIFPNGESFEPSRSDPAAMPRDAREMTTDLHTALAVAGVPGPIVFVGHSLGGLLGRVFATRYPDSVAGLVFVDAFSGELWRRLAAALSAEEWTALQSLETGLRRELEAIYPEVELLDLDAVIAEEGEATRAGPLRPMPAFVLTRGKSLASVVPTDAVPAGFHWDVVERESLAAQASLARLVPGARHEIAHASGHLIQLDEPERVVEAIRQVVEAVRKPRTWNHT